LAQIKIYGFASHLDAKKQQISDVIHSCVVGALQYPVGKRAHRFFGLAEESASPEEVVTPIPPFSSRVHHGRFWYVRQERLTRSRRRRARSRDWWMRHTPAVPVGDVFLRRLVIAVEV